MTQEDFVQHTYAARKPVGCYVYIHLSDEMIPYYVGKGTFQRAWLRAKRSRKWNGFYAKRGLKVFILKDGLSDDEAFELEVKTIDDLKRQGLSLANITQGGKTPERYRLYDTKSRDERKVKVYRSDGAVFESISDASRSMGMKIANGISNCLKGKAKWAGGYGWSTVEGQAVLYEGKPMPNKARPIESDVYGGFKSTHSAVKWLRSNGYESASNSAIHSCCNGKISYAYGSSWRYAEPN